LADFVVVYHFPYSLCEKKRKSDKCRGYKDGHFVLYVIIAYLSLYVIHFHCQNRVLIGKREKKEKHHNLADFLQEKSMGNEKNLKNRSKNTKMLRKDRPNCDAFSEKNGQIVMLPSYAVIKMFALAIIAVTKFQHCQCGDWRNVWKDTKHIQLSIHIPSYRKNHSTKKSSSPLSTL
jgi:hypothetical protein